MEEILSSNEPYPNAVRFRKTTFGLARFPTRIETLSIEKSGGGRRRLVARKDEVTIEFLLSQEECEHLAQILTE